MVEIRSCEYNFTDEFHFVLFASCVADFADDICSGGCFDQLLPCKFILLVELA